MLFHCRESRAFLSSFLWKLSINVCFQFSMKFLDSSSSHHGRQMVSCYLSILFFLYVWVYVTHPKTVTKPKLYCKREIVLLTLNSAASVSSPKWVQCLFFLSQIHVLQKVFFRQDVWQSLSLGWMFSSPSSTTGRSTHSGDCL